MYLFDFKSKLRRLNDQLYVDDTRARVVDGEYGACGIYIRRRRAAEGISAAGLNYVDKHARDLLTGEIDEFVMACSTQWVPEYDTFDLKTGKVLARGWRAMVMALVKRKFTTIERARRVFNCSGLGTTEYDHAEYESRLAIARERAGYVDAEAQALRKLRDSIKGLS